MPGLPSSLFMHELARRWAQVQAEQDNYTRAAQTVGALGEKQYGEQSKQAEAMGAMLQGSGRPLSEVAHLPGRLREQAELAYTQEGVDTERSLAKEERASKLKELLRAMQEEGSTGRTALQQLMANQRADLAQQGSNARTEAQIDSREAIAERNLRTLNPLRRAQAGYYGRMPQPRAGNTPTRTQQFSALERAIKTELLRFSSGQRDISKLPIAGVSRTEAGIRASEYAEMLQDLAQINISGGSPDDFYRKWPQMARVPMPTPDEPDDPTGFDFSGADVSGIFDEPATGEFDFSGADVSGLFGGDEDAGDEIDYEEFRRRVIGR